MPEWTTRRIHPVAVVFGVLLAVFDTLYGLLLVASVLGALLGLPLLVGGVAQLVFLRRHRSPTSTHPAAITGYMALVGLLGSAFVLTKWEVTDLAIFGVQIYATHVVIAAALWFASNLTDTTGQG